MRPDFPYPFLAVEGNIGSGKTHLAKALSSLLCADLLLEEFDQNPHIRPFYQGEANARFPLETSLRARRHELLAHYFSRDPSQRAPVVVSDFHPMKSWVFSRINLSGEERKAFESGDPFQDSSLPMPDLLVFLRPSLERIHKQIENRGRPYEKGISPDYLHQLDLAYAQFLDLEIPPTPTLIVHMPASSPKPGELARDLIALVCGQQKALPGKIRVEARHFPRRNGI